MASIQRQIFTKASADEVWSAISDIGALHTRLVPGFVVDTRLEGGDRIVTFGNGMIVREPIVDINHGTRRLAWSSIGGSLTHYNASVQVFAEAGQPTRVIWIADLLPNEAAGAIESMIEQGISVMKTTLDALADKT
jgi:Polyketide cyclase / dehydrase and lipid transport